MSKIAIIGSISMDLVMVTERLALEGETVFGESFSMIPGGKGANQAVAVGRLSTKDDVISIIGTVGQDSFAKLLLDNLKNNRLSTLFVGTVPQSTGVAQITIFNHDNRIIYCPGANNMVDTDKWDSQWQLLSEVDLVILQNEIPHEANLTIAKFCHRKGIKVLYNPAPARDTDLAMLDYVDFITPNESECQEIFPDQTIEEAMTTYPNKLIVTLGARGVAYYDGQSIQLIPAIKAAVVDTTGAGDTFNGALGFGISKGLSLDASLRFATLASHLSVQKFGAQGGMPTLNEMKESRYYEEKWNFK